MRRLRKETLGLVDDAPNVGRKLRVAESPRVVAPTGPFAVLDMYCGGEIWVHLRADVTGWVDDRRKVCAVYQVRNGLDPFNVDARGGEHGAWDEFGRDYVPVLVHVVEKLELGERPRVLPSVVRLQPLYECLLGWPECPDVITTSAALGFSGPVPSFLVGSPEVPVRTVADRELDGLVIGIGPVVDGEGHDEMVERRSHVVDEVTEGEAQRSWRRLEEGDSERFAQGIRLGLGNGLHRLGLEVGCKFHLERCQVLFRPAEFEIDAMEVGHAES